MASLEGSVGAELLVQEATWVGTDDNSCNGDDHQQHDDDVDDELALRVLVVCARASGL